VPDTVSLIIWLIGGIAGGFAVADLLMIGHPARNLISGAAGGVIGSQIIQLLIPALRDSNRHGLFLERATTAFALTPAYDGACHDRQSSPTGESSYHLDDDASRSFADTMRNNFSARLQSLHTAIAPPVSKASAMPAPKLVSR
jgi:hypothetical protein